MTDGRSAKEIFMDALDNLQAGEPEKARPYLERVIALDPEHAGAKNLLQQIDADPVQTLGKESFAYKVQTGESLSIIAKRYLGDAYKFYILAKYNGISVPNRVEAGQSIKIPGKRPPALPPPERPVAAPPEAVEAPPAIEADAEQPYQEGLRAMKAGLPVQAYEAFGKALAVKPNHAGAKAKQAELRPKVVEYYHRTATKAYRKQDMDEAIRNWDKVLEIDPANALAKSNRAKAMELKKAAESIQ